MVFAILDQFTPEFISVDMAFTSLLAVGVNMTEAPSFLAQMLAEQSGQAIPSEALTVFISTYAAQAITPWAKRMVSAGAQVTAS